MAVLAEEVAPSIKNSLMLNGNFKGSRCGMRLGVMKINE